MAARRALLSVSDKTGLVDLARGLSEAGVQLISTGGTAKLLAEQGLPVTEVSRHTGFPEIMDGRVKTLHPKIHGGLLCRRDKPEHLAAAERHGIPLIDLVVVNLYPFEATVAKSDVTFEDAIEHIDIGGPSMLRSAAKNHENVTVVCDPTDYDAVLAVLAVPTALSPLRRRLALKVFTRTAAYDKAISDYLAHQADEPDLEAMAGFPEVYTVSATKARLLHYGENPHQKAALYGRFFDCFEQLQGRELGYCNILDVTAAANLIGEFERPTVAILKHTNPCGVASSDTLAAAWEHAYATDTQAPFGGVLVINRTLDDEFYDLIRMNRWDIVICPDLTDNVRAKFAKKENTRVLIAREGQRVEAIREVRSVVGGFLVQDRDQHGFNRAGCKIVTRRQPTEAEWTSFAFAWRIVKHIKSNAIVYCGQERTLGIGAGQMSRVDSSRIAVWKAGEAGLDLHGACMASDALIPFADGLIAAAEAGATACIQTGGSVRDEEVIKAADERGMTMVFTGLRHFKH